MNKNFAYQCIINKIWIPFASGSFLNSSIFSRINSPSSDTIVKLSSLSNLGDAVFDVMTSGIPK